MEEWPRGITASSSGTSPPWGSLQPSRSLPSCPSPTPALSLAAAAQIWNSQAVTCRASTRNCRGLPVVGGSWIRCVPACLSACHLTPVCFRLPMLISPHDAPVKTRSPPPPQIAHRPCTQACPPETLRVGCPQVPPPFILLLTVIPSSRAQTVFASTATRFDHSSSNTVTFSPLRFPRR